MAPLMATALGFLLLTANSIIAINRSWGNAAATIFVIASYASLVLLFCFLRLFETAPPSSPARDRAKIGVWLTTTLLTAMFTSRVAGSVAFVLAADATLVLLFLCLRRFERARGEGWMINMGGPHSAQAKVGLAVLTSNKALDTYDARRDPVSAAFVFLSYAVLVILTANFIRAFADAHAGELRQED